MNIGTVIVTFNPDVNILKRTLQFLIEQKIPIVVVDNASENIVEFNRNIKNVKYLLEKNNVGIAKALNDGIKYLKTQGVDWVLTLDQDSIISENYFEEIKRIVPKKDVSVYCPKVIDRNESAALTARTETRKKKIKAANPKALFLPIQSGVFMNVSDFFKIGGFDESLFIDGVDFDYFLAVLSIDKLIVELKNTVLYQTVGNKKERSFLGFKFHPTNHSAIRYYYSFRNTPVIIKRYKKILIEHKSEMKSFFRVSYKKVVKVVLGENNKKDKLCAMFRGYLDRKSINVRRKHYV